jgi:hypothetical protein
MRGITRGVAGPAANRVFVMALRLGKFRKKKIKNKKIQSSDPLLPVSVGFLVVIMRYA